MPLAMPKKLTGLLTMAVVSVISGCVETTEMAGRDGYRPPRGVIGDTGLDQSHAAMFSAWAQSPVTIKMIVVALALTLMVTVIIGTILYNKAEHEKE